MMITGCKVLAVWCALLLLFCPIVRAQDDPLSGLIIEDGWMHGTVTAHFVNGYSEETFYDIQVDCAVPEEPYPAEILTTGNRFFSKADMQRALRAAGQSDQGKFGNDRTYSQYTGDWNAEASADISWEDAAKQAIQIGLDYFTELGVEVDPVPRSVSRPYDYESWLETQTEFFSHRFSDFSLQLERAQAQWKRRHKYDPRQSAYTEVDFTVLLDGMRLYPVPSYPAGYSDEPDASIGFSVEASVIVSDSGILVSARTSEIPEIQSRRPMSEAELAEIALSMHSRPLIPQPDGMSALRAALADSSSVGYLHSSSEDQLIQFEYMDEPVTAYGSQCVITAIVPYLFTISAHEWMPMWDIQCTDEYADGFRT